MAVEKAFAINASPEAIYAELERDLGGASEFEGRTFEVLKREPSKALDLRVTIGNIPCYLSYRIEPKPDHTEVAAKLTPYGMRYLLFRLATLGMREQIFAVTLVESLANLKEAVESNASSEFPDEEGSLVSIPDE